MPLFKFEGPVLDYNFKVRKENYKSVVKANNTKQAQILFTKKYRNEFDLSELCFLRFKPEYIKEITSEKD